MQKAPVEKALPVLRVWARSQTIATEVRDCILAMPDGVLRAQAVNEFEHLAKDMARLSERLEGGQ